MVRKICRCHCSCHCFRCQCHCRQARSVAAAAAGAGHQPSLSGTPISGRTRHCSCPAIPRKLWTRNYPTPRASITNNDDDLSSSPSPGVMPWCSPPQILPRQHDNNDKDDNKEDNDDDNSARNRRMTSRRRRPAAMTTTSYVCTRRHVGNSQKRHNIDGAKNGAREADVAVCWANIF